MLKKIILTILMCGWFSGFSLIPAYAEVLAVKGEVPDLPPLQPKPSGILPNYQNNINTPPEEQISTQEGNRPVEEVQSINKSVNTLNPILKNKVMEAAVIIFSVIAVAGGTMFLLKTDKS